MAFIVPTLNIDCNIWRRATWPPPRGLIIPPPDLANVPCQLRGWLKNLTAITDITASIVLQELVLAAGVDVRDPLFGGTPLWNWCDVAEIPSGSSRWFFIAGVADQAKGFGNEYRSALVGSTAPVQGTYYSGLTGYPWAPAWPTPYP